MADRSSRRNERPTYILRAENNYGIVGRDELLRAGLDSRAIWRRVRNGSLEEILPHTYRAPGAPACWEQDMAAALTWAGPNARASHRAAAALLELDGFDKREIEITTTRNLKKIEGVLVHRTQHLHRYDSMVVSGLTCTTPARTLLDLGAVCDKDRLEAAVEDALRRRLTSIPALEWELRTQGVRGRRGTTRFRELLQARPRTYVPTDSGLELLIERFLRSVVRPPRNLRLPPWVKQHPIATPSGRRLPDFAFVHQKVALEGHSFRWHSGRKSWESDQRRDRELRALGWDILYVTKEDVTSRREQLIDDLCDALERRGWNARPARLL